MSTDNGRTKHRTGHLYKRGKDGKELKADSKQRGKFYLQYRVNGKTIRQALGTTDRDEAERKRLEIMAPHMVADDEHVLETTVHRLEKTRKRRETIEVERGKAVLVQNAWLAYLDSANRPDTGEGTLRNYTMQYNRFAIWMRECYPDRKALRDVNSRIASEYAADLRDEGFSANTYNKHIRLLMLVFRILKRKANITDNPWEDITRLKSNPQSRRELTTDELRTVVEAADGDLKLLLTIGIYTGLRLGDCATLKWSEVDLNRGIILRVPSKTARSNGQPVHIPIHPILATLLKEHEANKKGGYVFLKIASMYKESTESVTDQIQHHFIYCGIDTHKEGTGRQIQRDENDKPLKHANGTIKFIKTGKRAVVEVGFHSLRHTFVSLCRGANAPLAVVEAIVGHSNPAMTRHYTHVGDAAAGKAIAALPSVTGNDGQAAGDEGDVAVLDQLKNMTAENWERVRDALVEQL